MKRSALVLCGLLLCSSVLPAEQVAVRYAEGLVHGFLALRNTSGVTLADGELLQVARGERPSLEQVLNGPSDDPFGSLNLVGGLRRSMAKAGYCDLKEFQKVGLTVGS